MNNYQEKKGLKKYVHLSSSKGWWQSWRKVPVAFQMQENFTKFRNFWAVQQSWCSVVEAVQRRYLINLAVVQQL